MNSNFEECTELYSFQNSDQLNNSNITDNINDLSFSFDESKNGISEIYGEKEESNPISSTLSSIKKDNTRSINTGINEILPIRKN